MTRVFPNYKISKCTSNIIVINSVFHWIQSRITSSQLSHLIRSFLGFKSNDTFLWGICRTHSQPTLYINPRLPDGFLFEAWLNSQILWWGPSALSLRNEINAFNNFLNENSERIRYFCEYYDLEQIGEFIVRVLTAIRDVVLQKTRPDDRQLYGRLIDFIIRVITNSIAANSHACDNHLTDNPDLQTPIFEFLYHNDVIARRDDGRRDIAAMQAYARVLEPEMTWLNDYYRDPASSEYLRCCRGPGLKPTLGRLKKPILFLSRIKV